MDSQHSWCISFTALIYLALLLQPATGKCVGKWAIHSCFGGNGKRSDPSIAQTIDTQKQSNLLRQLLLRERFPPSVGLDMNEEQDRDESDLNSFQDDLPQRPSAERQSDIDRLNIMLRTLMLQRKLRLAAERLA
ncbi:uncharacterized protein [Haliotis cracherodii]|uniref:uncharacterized protein LOC124145234 n=1 Tax=Haliotis rufescens TaxID=6454 RepID=UPI001EAFD1B4|nr:uncharacterized protein LOC124145234 [Haliotis rufescens]